MQKGISSLILQLYPSIVCVARAADGWIAGLPKRTYLNIDSIDRSPECSVSDEVMWGTVCKAMLGGVYCLRHELYEPWYAHT